MGGIVTQRVRRGVQRAWHSRSREHGRNRGRRRRARDAGGDATRGGGGPVRPAGRQPGRVRELEARFEGWAITGAGDTTIQGFATTMSLNPGSTEHFKIKTTASAYHLDIYRMGYYGGAGARRVATASSRARRCRRPSPPV